MLERDIVTRRDFLKEAGAAAAVVLLMRDQVVAQDDAKPATPVNIGIIGTGQHGQTLLSNLSRVPGANIVAICDFYEPHLKKAQEIAPKAIAGSDYKRVIEAADGIIIATPTHLHKDIVLEAIQAGKHVYCEAPLAVSLEDAKTIAKAGSESKKVFQVGLQQRANQMYRHALKFYRSAALSRTAEVRAQYHRKHSWKKAGANPQVDRQLNWKLARATSNGLVGEIGTHQIDVITWYLRRPPIAVFGYGSTKLWDDGRDAHDTIQCVFEYPNDMRVFYDATIANSFDGSYEIFTGTEGAILLRDDRAWIFKEADAPVWGWEVYAKADKIGDEEGISLVADASKLLALGKDPAKEGAAARAGKNAFYDALEEFLICIRENKKPVAGAVEGFQATAVAIKASEAIWSKNKVEITPEMVTL